MTFITGGSDTAASDGSDLVGTMLYLLSDISSFVTGVVIPVDGGYAAFGGV
ncbi:MAG: hypothetical protein II095_04935 [Bacteroidales bacterium]|nr:hypothetical protein [Bacteroidales bacterium]